MHTPLGKQRLHLAQVLKAAVQTALASDPDGSPRRALIEYRGQLRQNQHAAQPSQLLSEGLDAEAVVEGLASATP